MRAGLKLSKGLHHMQHVKYKIIGITISIICIALMSIIIYDCKERVKKEKQIRKKLESTLVHQSKQKLYHKKYK